jgi:peptidoglycan/LPS O-acetylase OafA/YrhL
MPNRRRPLLRISQGGDGLTGHFEDAAPSLPYYPHLDGLRALAVAGVLAQHCFVPGMSNAGTTGVTLFFTLSGFLITRLLLQERLASGRIDLRRFYKRRAQRLGPALLAMLAVVAVLSVVGALSMRPVLLSLLQVANIAEASGQNMGLLDHMWSLSMEEQFYLLWPALLLFLTRARRWDAIMPLLGATAVASVIVRTALELHGAPAARIMLAPDTRADALLIGCALGIVVHRIPPRVARLSGLMGAVVLLAVLPAGPYGSWTLLPVALASAAVICWIVTSDGQSRGLRILATTPLVRVGRISYGIYLWHMLALTMLWPVASSGARLGLAAAASSVGLAYLSNRFIERPFLRSPSRNEERAEPTLVH